MIKPLETYGIRILELHRVIDTINDSRILKEEKITYGEPINNEGTFVQFLDAIESINNRELWKLPQTVINFYNDLPDSVFEDTPPSHREAQLYLNTYKDDELIQLYNNGHTFHAISEILKIAPNRVAYKIRILQNDNIIEKRQFSYNSIKKRTSYNGGKWANSTPPLSYFTNPSCSEDQVNSIIRGYLDGMSIQEITKITNGPNRNQVHSKIQHLRKYKIIGPEHNRTMKTSVKPSIETIKPQPKEEPQPSALEQLLNGVESRTNNSAEEISTHHKEMLIEILHKVIQ